jgi:hypothetical protein
VYLTYRYGEKLDNCTPGNSIDIHIVVHWGIQMYLTHKFGWFSYTRLLQKNLHIFYIADPHEEDKMTADGVMKFLEDLSLNPESRTVLILAWRFKAATQCEFSKDEFITGMIELRYMYLFFLEFIFFS